jgi:hypothetical protein
MVLRHREGAPEAERTGVREKITTQPVVHPKPVAASGGRPVIEELVAVCFSLGRAPDRALFERDVGVESSAAEKSSVR